MLRENEVYRIHLPNNRCFTTSIKSIEEVLNFTLWRKKCLMECNQTVFPVYDEIIEAINKRDYDIINYNTGKVRARGNNNQ